MRRVLLVIAWLVLLGACATENRGPVDTGAEAPEEETPAAGQKTFPAGEKVQTKSGNFVTLHAYEQPVATDNEFMNPEEGKDHAAVDVEFCAGPNPPEGSAGVNPFDFELQMADNRRIDGTVGIKDPSLNDTTLPPGECARGWVTYEVPAGERAAFLIYTGDDTILKFQVP